MYYILSIIPKLLSPRLRCIATNVRSSLLAYSKNTQQGDKWSLEGVWENLHLPEWRVQTISDVQGVFTVEAVPVIKD